MVMSHTRVRPALLLLVLAGTAALTACDQRSDATKAVQAATQSLHAVGVAPGTGTPKYEAKLKEIAGSLADAASSGTQAEQGSAALLLTQTSKGQGEIAALAAKDLELQVRNKITLINGLLADCSRHSSAADALESFDPSADIAAFKKLRVEREAELKTHEASLAAAQASRAKFESEAKAVLTQAEAAAREYAALSQSTVKMTATEAAEVVKKANEFRRVADDLRTRGGKLQAQADLMLPTINEHTLLAAKASNQIKNFDTAVAEFEARLAASRAEAKASRDAATVASNDLDKVVAEIIELRSKNLTEAYAAALKQFNDASGKSTKSNTASAGMSKVIAGSMKLSIAETHWANAQGGRALAATLDTLASVKPVLPNASDYAKKAGEARDAAKTEIDAAAQALDEAKAAFESARVTDKVVKERFTKLGEQIAKAKDLAMGVAPAAPVAEAPAADGGSPDATPAASAEPVDPALLAFADQVLTASREGRSAELIDTAIGLDDAAKSTLKQVAGMQDSLKAVDKACREKFQKSMNEVLASNPMMAQMMKAQGLSAGSDSLKASDLSFTVEGDSATATGDGLPRPLKFAKKDGAWAIDMTAEGQMVPMLQAQAGMIAKVGEVMSAWGTDISAGKFADPAAAAAGLMMSLQAVMGGAGGPGGGG
jgi:hypothetical protein